MSGDCHKCGRETCDGCRACGGRNGCPACGQPWRSPSPTKKPFLARWWDMGRPVEVARRFDHGMTVEVVTPEGHVVQVVVTQDNKISVRAWLHPDQYENGGSNSTVFTASGYLREKETPDA